MKLLIDIPEEDYKFIKDLQSLIIGSRGSYKTIQYNVINAIKNGISCEEPPSGEYVGEWAKGFHEGFNAGTMLAEAFNEDTPVSTDGDLISRSELKKKFGYTDEWYKSRTVAQEIDNAPTVELFCAYLSDGEVRQPCLEAPCKHERPQGKWEKCQNNMFRCSNCRQADEVPTAMGTPIYSFCPNCGARMQKGDAE